MNNNEDRAVRKVIIDPGHGGTDSGATGNNLLEKDYNLLISKYMYDRFKELGIPVAITRDSDTTLSPTDRVNTILNKFGNSSDVILISNHVNSGGERRRTEIARCLAIDPKFIMLDEPFAGVDPIAVEDIQHIVWKLKDKNIGILITDHNALETLRLTDRAYLLFEGKILFQGTPEELAENPVVREKYLGTNFVLRRKDFQLAEKDRQGKNV